MKAVKFPAGNAGALPCLKCRLKRRTFEDEVMIQKQSSKVVRVHAFCECCGIKMHEKRPIAREFKITITLGCNIVEILPRFVKSDKRFIHRKDTPKEKFQLQD